MPIYEYECGKCGNEFEREQRISDDPVKTCPECRSRRVKRLISRTSFLLKGGGWHSDLYGSAKDTKKDADKESKSESAKSDSSSKGDSDKKKSDDKKDKTKSKADKKSAA
ncbi:MAG: zinc ribbon domain-containing protein [Proteobacteria bacterium]|nr:zinc ribbon domain-containing protein [Pseudomonadota bacterium]MCZ6784336.1 zinc ribbon domain-containing protein [Pseudomonadota bacterium]